MDRVAILCEKDKYLMHRFSRQSVGRARSHSLLLTALPFFSAYLDANVKKEVDKDRLIIEVAAGNYYAGTPLSELDLEDVFDKTKQIDKAFLKNFFIPSFSVRYSDFADIRIRRIWLISRTVFTLLENWPDTASFTDAVKNAYTGMKFKERLIDILHLYNEETRMVSKSLRLFGPLNKAAGSSAETLYQAMEEITEDLAALTTKIIYGDETIHA